VPLDRARLEPERSERVELERVERGKPAVHQRRGPLNVARHSLRDLLGCQGGLKLPPQTAVLDTPELEQSAGSDLGSGVSCGMSILAVSTWATWATSWSIISRC
jgi:hypothetical protein